MTTEETYIRGLTTLDRYYRQALIQSGIKESTIDAIFSSLPQILDLHNQQVLPQLQLRCTPVAPEKLRWNVAQVFIDFADKLSLYCDFVNNYERALQEVTKIRKANKDVDTLFENAKVLKETNGLDFFSLFITVIQRLPRYVLLLEDLKKHVPASKKEYKLLQRAIAAISAAAQEINERKAEYEDGIQLARLSEEISGLPSKLNAKGRRIVDAGIDVGYRKKPTGEFKSGRFWLFNDSCLLIRASKIPLGKPFANIHFVHLAVTEFKEEDANIVTFTQAKISFQVRIPSTTPATEYISKLYQVRSRAPQLLESATSSPRLSDGISRQATGISRQPTGIKPKK